METLVSTYKTVSKIPGIYSAHLSNNGKRVSAKWSVRNIDKGKKTQYLYDYILDKNLHVLAESDFGTDVSNELLTAVSPKETFRAVIREENNDNCSKKYFLEVWQANLLQHSINLTALDIHGDVYGDSEFGSLEWSPDESSVVYIAEKKLPKLVSYFKRTPQENGCGDQDAIKGAEFVYREDWGEQLEGKHRSVIVVAHIETETVTVMDKVEDWYFPGQVRFTPDSKSIVGVAWLLMEQWRLGIIYCTNRMSCLFKLRLADQEFTTITSLEDKAVRSPRYCENGDLIWLYRTKSGVHHSCLELRIQRAGSDGRIIMVPIINNEVTISNGKFHGIYAHSLPKHCFSKDYRIVFSTPQKTEVRSFVLDMSEENGRLVDITNKAFKGSTTVLDIRNDIILAVCSNLTTPAQLFVARLPKKNKEADIRWIRVSKPIEVQDGLASSVVEYMYLEHDNNDYVTKFSAIYMAPKTDKSKKVPLIVWPHGGPHSSFTNTFNIDAAFFNLLGFAILQVNYRGSTGSGQGTVNFLPRFIGDRDVKDCKLATDVAINTFEAIDKEKIVLSGGSHGGFLVTHLSGQYPDFYKAVSCRNPVIDLASLVNYSDIPDWCYVEVGVDFFEIGPANEQLLVILRRCSPLAHVHKVSAPTAIFLGTKDKRVPYYQGLEYSRRLITRQIVNKVYTYDDNHALSKISSEADYLINTAGWFFKHLKLKSFL